MAKGDGNQMRIEEGERERQNEPDESGRDREILGILKSMGAILSKIIFVDIFLTTFKRGIFWQLG